MACFLSGWARLYILKPVLKFSVPQRPYVQTSRMFVDSTKCQLSFCSELLSLIYKTQENSRAKDSVLALFVGVVRGYVY